MFLDNIEKIYITMSYLIPGFIINSIILNKLSIKNTKEKLSIYNYLIFSFLNIFIYMIIDFLVIKLNSGMIVVSNEHIIMFLRNFLIPILISIAILFLLDKFSFVKKTLSFLGLERSNMTISSWDYLFFELKKGRGNFVIIELKEEEEKEDKKIKKRIYGYYGKKSFASNNFDGTKDIYLEEVFKDVSMKNSMNCGMLICDSEISKVYIPLKNVVTEEKDKGGEESAK